MSKARLVDHGEGMIPQRGGIIHNHGLGRLSAEHIADLRFRQNAQRLHALGPRATAEAFAELGVRYGIQTGIDEVVARHAGLSTEVLEATGGTDFPPVPVHEVRRR